jgi:hypothetical protein
MPQMYPSSRQLTTVYYRHLSLLSKCMWATGCKHNEAYQTQVPHPLLHLCPCTCALALVPLHLCPCTADDALPKFFKTANGVRVQELRVGQGPQAQQGDGVLIDFVLRRANGYFIYGECCTAIVCSCLLCSGHWLHISSPKSRVGADHAISAARLECKCAGDACGLWPDEQLVTPSSNTSMPAAAAVAAGV